MHKCVKYDLFSHKYFEEEYSWSIALYIELNLNDEEVIVCRHPSYIVIDNLKEFAEKIHHFVNKNKEIEVTLEISKLLSMIFPDWRKNFEIVIRNNLVSITSYL